MDITLTHQDAEVILQQFDDFNFGHIRLNSALFKVILKLTGDVASGPGEVWVLRSDGEDKVSVIKSVRTLLNLGLKEAKDYADGQSGQRRLNGDVIIDPRDCVFGNDIVLARGHISCIINRELKGAQ
jgi:hypothetical protein